MLNYIIVEIVHYLFVISELYSGNELVWASVVGLFISGAIWFSILWACSVEDESLPDNVISIDEYRKQ